jgi:hypothetical protein
MGSQAIVQAYNNEERENSPKMGVTTNDPGLTQVGYVATTYLHA